LHEGGTLMTSVCTGSLVYAAAGLLRNRPATTYWNALGLLAELDPTIEVRPHDRFVDDGDVVTAAGVSAGIDMALHLVVRLDSEEAARRTKRGIQYDPQPPI
jgi:transcriptional regulator GlxA family with amidase domain